MPNPGVSIVYVTHRPQPRFEWFADSLARQLGDDAPEVVVVDGLYSPQRGEEMAGAAAGRFPFRHVAAKPTPFNGPQRLTGDQYMAAASARNTGIVCATHPYIVFVDDLAVAMPGWWDRARLAAAAGYVVGGAYQKHRELVVEDGALLQSRSELSGIDTRWAQGDDSRPVPLAGGQLYGCSLGAPRELLLELGGFDELCDSIAGEDYQLGMRLEWAGAEILYDRRLLTIESDDLHEQEPVLVRIDRVLDEDRYMAKLREFGVERRGTDGACDASHMVLDVLLGTRSVRSLGNPYVLRDLTEAGLPATVELFPSHHWFDGTPLAEM